MRIGNRQLGPGSVLVVAEVGNNHDGSMRQAERLVEAAAEAGADAVKSRRTSPRRRCSPRHLHHRTSTSRARVH